MNTNRRLSGRLDRGTGADDLFLIVAMLMLIVSNEANEVTAAEFPLHTGLEDLEGPVPAGLEVLRIQVGDRVQASLGGGEWQELASDPCRSADGQRRAAVEMEGKMRDLLVTAPSPPRVELQLDPTQAACAFLELNLALQTLRGSDLIAPVAHMDYLVKGAKK